MIEPSRRQPEMVVVAGFTTGGLELRHLTQRGAEHAVPEHRVATFVSDERRLLPNGGELVVGQERPVTDDRGPLQGRARIVRPHAFEIRLAVRGARHDVPRLRRLLRAPVRPLGADGGMTHERQRCSEHQPDPQRLSHRSTPWKAVPPAANR